MIILPGTNYTMAQQQLFANPLARFLDSLEKNSSIFLDVSLPYFLFPDFTRTDLFQISLQFGSELWTRHLVAH